MIAKRLFLATCCLLVALVLKAQPEAGTLSVVPRVGMTLANMTSNEVLLTFSEQPQVLGSRMKPGLAVGADAEWQATDQVFLSLGVRYSRQGSRYPDFERTYEGLTEGVSDSHTDLDYLNFPLLVGYRIYGGFSVKAGLQLGVLLSAKQKYSDTEIIPLDDGGRKQGLAMAHSDDLYSGCRKVDFSVPLGVSYEFEHVVVDACYHWGLSRIGRFSEMKSRNSVVSITVGYRFPL